MSKRAYIYCGVPGAGKSTLIERAHPTALVCSADLFDGLYPSPGVIDASKLGPAHGWCLRTFASWLIQGDYHKDEIVVDNTNTTIAELAPYAALALAYGYELSIRTLWCDPVVAHARNTHGVPLHVVQAMHERLKTRDLPPWWPHSDVPQMEAAS